MLGRVGHRASALTATFGLLAAFMVAPVTQAQTQSRRAVVAHDENEIPQFTIQIDAFETLTEAVEFGYELPFDENTLGLAKFRQGAAVRYILALGTFYTYGEADGVRREMCPSADLDNCRVRYLGDLESIEADGSEEAVLPTVIIAKAEISPDVTIMPPLVIEEDLPASVVEEDLSVSVSASKNYPSEVLGPEYFEEILDEEDALLDEPEVLVEASEPISQVALPDPSRVYDGELVYTVQVAAMYREADAEQIVEQVPSSMGQANISALIGGRGNLVYSVTVGRFAYKDNAQVFAEDICDAVGLSGCWVKPLALLERELEQVSTAAAPLLSPEIVEPELQPTPKAIESKQSVADRLIYTVQVAAMYDEADAQGVASRISEQYGAAEVVPIRSVNGDVVYSVTVGRFAFKDEGQEIADNVCNQLNLSGCWVKPFDLIEKARVQEW